MGDMSSLSYEYTVNASFAEDVNKWLVAVKKAALGVELDANAGGDPLEEARRGLAAAVESTLSRLEAMEGAKEETGGASAEVPEDVVRRVEAKHRSDLAWFLEDLRNAQSALLRGDTLGPRELQALDEITDVADASASECFRRLWRR